MQCFNCGGWMDYRTIIQEIIRHDGRKVMVSVQGWKCGRCGEVSLDPDEQRKIRDAAYATSGITAAGGNP